MYRTFEQALNDISGNKQYKNENYHMTRIRSLIKNGELTEGKPTELFVRDSSGEFVSIGRVKTEPLVTKESISEYVNARNSEISDRGCVTKGGKPIRAIFTDGSESEFLTMGDVVRFFLYNALSAKASTTDKPPDIFSRSAKTRGRTRCRSRTRIE